MTNASQKFEALVELLRTNGGFDISAHIWQVVSSDSKARPEWVVELAGADSPLLTQRNGELLHAIEHIAAKMLCLEPDEHDRISFDADNFKAKRYHEISKLASAAIVEVRTTATPFVFPPMMSRERRLLHLALASSGLHSASIGERFHRSVVLYPEGVTPPPV